MSIEALKPDCLRSPYRKDAFHESPEMGWGDWSGRKICEEINASFLENQGMSLFLRRKDRSEFEESGFVVDFDPFYSHLKEKERHLF